MKLFKTKKKESEPLKVRLIKSNNPMAIRINPANNWKGRVSPSYADPFEEFITIHYGIRALIITLRNYRKLHGLKTIRDIISRYAPPSENNTENYIQHVCKIVGKHSTEQLTRDDEFLLLLAICDFETNYLLYMDTYEYTLDFFKL